MSEISQAVTLANPWWESPSHRRRATLPNRRQAPFEALKAVAERSPGRSLVLRGPRRVGKTELLLQLVDWWLGNARLPPGQLCYVDFSDPLLARAGDGTALFDQVLAAWPLGDADGPRLALFDELQSIEGWDRWLKHTLDWRPGLRVIATGSSSLRLSDGGRESGRGRWDDRTIEGLTFPERLQLLVSPSEPTPERVLSQSPLALRDHLELGGLPEYLHSNESRAEIRLHMRAEVDREIGAELATFVRDVDVTRRLFLIFARESGNRQARKKLADGLGVDRTTLGRHIEGLEHMLLIHRLSPFPSSSDGTSVARSQRLLDDKIYLAEPGHIGAYSALASPLENPEIAGRIYEAVVFHALRAAQRDIGYEEIGYFGRAEGAEIDFVLGLAGTRVGIEVTASARADKKVASARQAGQEFGVPVLVVHADRTGTATASGGPHVGLQDFLLDPTRAIRRMIR